MHCALHVLPLRKVSSPEAVWPTSEHRVCSPTSRVPTPMRLQAYRLYAVPSRSLCARLWPTQAKRGSVVVNNVRLGKGDYGYNAREDKYENMKESGIIDPAKVTRVALENAASIAGMFLTTECVICDAKEENPAPAMGAGAPGMGGMM